MFPCAFQHFSQIGKTVCEISRLNHHIINIDFHQLADELVENKIHGSLIGSTSIFQAKSHDYPLKQTNINRTSKCSLRNIILNHEYLIVSCIAIHKTNNPMSSYSINQQIGNWHWITIHRRGFIEIPKVNANTKFSILFVDRNNIGNPFGISILPNKLSLNEFGYFGLNIGKNIRVTLACRLLMCPKSRFHRQLMSVFSPRGVTPTSKTNVCSLFQMVM